MFQIEQHNDRFRQLLASYHLTYQTWYQRLYAFGTIQNHAIAFKWIFPQASTIPNYAPYLFLRIKIPHTAQQPIYLTTAITGAASSLASLVGWQEAAPGFYLGKLRGHSTDEQRTVFQKFSAAQLQALQQFTQQYGPVSLTPDFATTIVGKPAALTMVNHDQALYDCLDLQVRLALDDQADQQLPHWLDDSIALANLLEQAFA